MSNYAQKRVQRDPNEPVSQPATKAFERDPNELGVLWQKASPRGTYLSGTIEWHGERVAVVVFTNTKKKSERAPDFRILRADRTARPAAQAYQHENVHDDVWS